MTKFTKSLLHFSSAATVRKKIVVIYNRFLISLDLTIFCLKQAVVFSEFNIRNNMIGRHSFHLWNVSRYPRSCNKNISSVIFSTSVSTCPNFNQNLEALKAQQISISQETSESCVLYRLYYLLEKICAFGIIGDHLITSYILPHRFSGEEY